MELPRKWGGPVQQFGFIVQGPNQKKKLNFGGKSCKVCAEKKPVGAKRRFPHVEGARERNDAARNRAQGGAMAVSYLYSDRETGKMEPERREKWTFFS